MLWSTVLSAARDIVQEDTASFWDDADFLVEANFYMNEIALLLPLDMALDYKVRLLVAVASSGTATKDYERYALPTTLLKIFEVRYACGKTNTPRPCYICSDFNEFMARIEESDERTLARHPICLNWQNCLYVAPRAIDYDGGGYTVSNGIEVFALREPTALTSGSSTIELPEIGCSMLKHAITAYAWDKAGDREQAAVHRNEYRSLAAQLKGGG